MGRRAHSDRCLECETCIGGKCTRHIQLARKTDTTGNRPQGVVVEWETEFNFSQLGAAYKAKHNPGHSGKRMVSTSFSNNAPTQVGSDPFSPCSLPTEEQRTSTKREADGSPRARLQVNLPHNQFVKRPGEPAPARPHEPGSAAHAATAILVDLRRAAKDGNVPLLESALARAAEIADRPFEEWLNAELDNYGSTALHYAAKHGRTTVLRALLAKGAVVDARNRDHKTPLHMAASNGTASGVRALVESGRADMRALDLEGNAPLDCAEIWGNVQTAPALRQLALGELAGTRLRVQSAGRLDQPRRIASYKHDGVGDGWAVEGGFARAHVRHHVSVQRVGVFPCTEAWGGERVSAGAAPSVIRRERRHRQGSAGA